jgi:hypothetical protein
MEQLRAELSKRVNDACSNASNIMQEEVCNANEAMERADDSMPVADDSSRVTPSNTTQPAVSQALNIAERALNSATGTFWLVGEVSRKWTGERLFGADQVTDYNADVRVAADDRLSCIKWAVVTTIFDPAEGVRRAAFLEGWCVVIVAATKTPKDSMKKNQI